MIFYLFSSPYSLITSPDPDSIKKTSTSHKRVQEETKCDVDAASKAINVLERLQTINIKSCDDTEKPCRAQTDLTILDQVVFAYYIIRPHLRTNSVTRGLQTKTARAWAKVETENSIESVRSGREENRFIRSCHTESGQDA